MGDTDRPVPERDGDQEEQAAHLTRTGNGPTVDDEQQLLAEQYGHPDMAGVYSGPEIVAASSDGEPADQGDAAEPTAADSSEGGESA
jgi:hypothetical protein